jgi:hypothetical protein
MQFELFAMSEAERVAAAQAIRRRARRPQMPASRWVQLDLLASTWLNRHEPLDDDDEEDDPFVTAPLVHRLVPAHLTPLPQTSGIRSIFDFAATVLSVPDKSKRRAPPQESQPLSIQAQRHGRTEREVGVTRHVAMRHDETEEWQERERRRRARQRVPRPVKAARTRGRKLIDLIGTGENA